MAKLYVFGIGGTGSRVLRSLTMLMAAGVNMGTTDTIVPIIIDPDAANADLTRTIGVMNNYQSVRSYVNFSQDVDTQFFRCDMQRTMQNYILRIKDTNDKLFSQFMNLSGMDRTSQALMKMLFSDKNLNSSMNVGFKGNPNIGSVVLNQMVNSQDFQTFANSFAQGDKIFIISSIFGGTGASGFPLLLKTLRTGNNYANFAMINQAEIGAITVLPYFKVQSDNDSEIDSSTFISKTKSALAYYENNIINNGSINTLYYIGDEVTNTYANHEGGTAQQNDAHLIEFLSATAIVDFANGLHQEDTVNKELGLEDVPEASAVTFHSFSPIQRAQLFTPLTSLMMTANCLLDKFDFYSSSTFNANDGRFTNIYGSTFMSELRRYLQSYKDWFDEMKRNQRSLDLFNLSTGDKPFDLLTGYLPKKVTSMKSNYDLVTDRLNSAARKSISNDECSKFLEMFYNGTKRLVTEKFRA